MEEVENYGLPEDPDDEEELLIVKKIFDMMEYAYLALAQFPPLRKTGYCCRRKALHGSPA
jgi:hypothetical protein